MMRPWVPPQEDRDPLPLRIARWLLLVVAIGGLFFLIVWLLRLFVAH